MTGVRVKICGITRLQDLQDAVEAGADALGFVFTPRSRRVLSAVDAAALVRRVPAFVARVGLFMDQSADEVERVMDQVPLSLLQFHGGEDAAFCRRFGLPYLKAVSMGSGESVQAAAAAFEDAAGLLLDSHRAGQAGGTGRPFDWSLAPRVALPLVLAGGLTPDNVRRAVREVQPWAVDVSSGVEDAPGIKNRHLMSKFISEAKSEHG